MSKAEHMGVSPAQVSYHAKNFSSPKVITPDQPYEYGAESKCNGLTEGRHHLGSEILQTENGGTTSAVLQFGAVETLQPCPENDFISGLDLSKDAGKSHAIDNNSSPKLAASKDLPLKDLGPIPEDACKSNWTDTDSNPNLEASENHKLGVVCALARSLDVIKSGVLKKEPRGSNTVLSSSIVDETLEPEPEDVAKNSCNKDSELPLGDTSKNCDIDKCSNHHQAMPKQILQFSSDKCCAEPSGGTQNPGFELVHDGQAKLFVEHVESFPGPLTTSAPIGSLSLPHGGAMKTPCDEKLQPDNMDKKLETPSKDLVSNTVHRKRRVKNNPASSSKKYTLRSSNGDQRVLRSRSKDKTEVPESSDNLAIGNPSKEKRRKKYKKRRGEGTVADEYSRIRIHLRYLLNRISYEQSLITAYSGEGWKGLSLEKLKPEKELQRASSEIFRRKTKIRDLFQHIDSLCAEGKFPASLFDSEGQIDSEDIFCAKCCSKELTHDNDIILCDGACDRGFHQFCLLPPLLKEHIPPDDEGWLCPGCDCKVDCIDLLNKYLGIKISISDSWEKVFPEAASTAERNPEQDFGLPSEDSDDNDYSPDGPDVDENSQGNGSSSDEADITSASEELEPSPNDEKYAGLPSDDSEDDDFNLDASGLEEDMRHETSSSDFTSDSEDLVAAINDELPTEDQSHTSTGTHQDFDLKLGGRKKDALNGELLSTFEANAGHDGLTPISAKRNVERLDYKMLYDETYGNISSGSCDDEDYAEDFTDGEDFGDTTRPRKRKKKSTSDTASLSVNEDAMVSESAEGSNRNLNKPVHTPKRKTSRKSNFESESTSPAKAYEGTGPSTSSGKRVRASAYKRLGEAVTQRLYSSFKENRYPKRAAKDSLATELGLTFQQVDRWFGNARWSFNHPSLMSLNMAASTSGKESSIQETNEKVLEPGPEGVTRDASNNVSPSEGLPKVVIAAAATGSGGADSLESAKTKSKPTRKSRKR